MFADSVRRQQSNAEILLWQTKFRLGFILINSAVGNALVLLGALRRTRIASTALSDHAALLLASGVVLAYAATVLALHVRMQRTRRAGPATVAAVIGADLLLIFATVFLMTPPAYFERALLLALVCLQLTQIYFGRSAAAASLLAITFSYVLLVAGGIREGFPLNWGEELWTLALYILGGVVLIAVQGTHAERLERIMGLFERAEEGDFARTYDVDADTRPDRITVVGRAYNRMRAQLSTIVLTDALSGCVNRRGFEEQLTREIARTARAGNELALLAIDVDYFKLINDTFGHLAGDAAIREIGQLLRDTARTGDVVSRVGGEEFMILCPETGAAGAFNAANRILEAFRKRAFDAVRGRLPVTVSIGVVADRIHDRNVGEDLRARADEALYAAKRAGRNRVVVWTSGLHSAGVLSDAQRIVETVSGIGRAWKPRG